MKVFLKTIAIVAVTFLIFTFLYNYFKEEVKETVLNNVLEVIKPGWKGNLKIDGEFVNFNEKDRQITPLEIFKWKVLSNNPQADEKKADTFQLQLIEGSDWIESEKDMIVWLGHASFFIRLGGHTFITDPVFYDMSFVKRHVGIPCPVKQITGIDYIMLSHGHRDHFDKKSIDDLFKVNPEIEVLVPLDNISFFESKGIKYREAGWYQKYKMNNEIEVFFLPAKHWNRRGLLDFNKTLWGSFIIRFKGKTIYFAGDTSFGDHFEEIGKMFPEIDYCLMPVGAYKPEEIMKEAHLSPWEAWEAFQSMKARTFIPMHYGTYDLADEPLGESLRVIEGFNDDRIKILKVGEIMEL